jgi:hypothetical protein
MDPTLFTQAGSGREKNDGLNTQREEFLGKLYHLETSHPLQAAWRSCIDSLCSVPFDRVAVEQRGGRHYHYDFHVTYYQENAVVCQQRVEYKHNSSSVGSLPQFLSLPEKAGLLPSYAYFYYTQYLPKYIACDPEFPVPIPDFNTYIQKVRSTDYSCHPFFQALYDRESIAKEAKQQVVKESIRVFLHEHANLLNVRLLRHLFVESQTDKVFVLWDLKEFHTERMTFGETFQLTGIHEKGHTLFVSDGHHTFHLLLRWRNHMGILNPAWQISLGK